MVKPARKQSKPARAQPGKGGISVKDGVKYDGFFIYLNRRMRERVRMHKTPTALKTVKVDVPFDPILSVVTSGNAYRHLDKVDAEEGAAYRALVGIKEGKRASLPSAGDEPGEIGQLGQLLMLCLLRMAGFNPERMREWASECRGGKRAAMEAVSPLPYTTEEALHLAKWLEAREPPHKRPHNPKMFEGAGWQVQGFRWVGYLRQWLKPPKGKFSLKEATLAVANAETWEEANNVIQLMPGVGPYTGAQALCTLLYGVFGGDHSLLFINKKVGMRGSEPSTSPP